MKLTHTRDVINKLVPKYIKGKTLDIGGGTSKYRSIITPYVSEYLVSDLYPVQKIDFIEDARKLSHKDKTFDSILSFQVLEHIDDTKAVVKEMYRVLKYDGIAMVTVPFLCAQHGHPSDFHRFTVDGLRWYFEQEGFKVIEVGKQGSSFAVISELFRFAFLNPYKNHGRIKTAILTRIIKGLTKLDKCEILQNENIYGNVYIVAQK
jgi:SAM-dependent methyltransferase